MTKSFPTRVMRENPDIDQLKRQAKELLAAFIAGQSDAVTEVNTHYRDADANKFALHDAQLVLARAYGFDSWPKLKAYVDGVTIKRFADAVTANDIAQTRAMLKSRPELADMQMSYGDEHRPLHFAVMNRLSEMTRLLMQHGANARAGIHPYRDATTALKLATERGYDEIVAIIHEEEQKRREARAHIKTDSSADELCDAISRGDDARAIAMMEADPNLINACHRDGWTPLHIAAAVLNCNMVTWLLNHGANTTHPGEDNLTPLDMAATGRGRCGASGTEKFSTVTRLLRKHGAEMTARAAVALGDVDWLRARHAEGSLVNQILWSDGGLLTIAVNHDKPEILEMLLDFGFDPDERVRLDNVDHIHYSQAFPLYHCAGQGKQAMAEMLLKRGANPNAHVDSGGSCVHSAYSSRQWEMVDLLKRYGGIVTADTVAIYRDTEAARQLLVMEAEGRLPEGSFSTYKTLAEELLIFAADGGDPEIVRMALERIDWPREDTRWSGILGHPMSFWNHMPWWNADNKALDRSTYIKCFRLILERCDPNLIGGFNRTALHDVAAMDDYITDEECAEFAVALLDAGARTDVRDGWLKSTPLGWACRWGKLDLVKLLLERGADPIEADAESWATPKAWARKMGHEDILALLGG